MPLLTVIRDLHRRKARERRGLALAEGVRLVEEMIAAEAPCKGAAIAPSLEATPRGAALVEQIHERGIDIARVSDEDMAILAATEHPQGIVAAYVVREWGLTELVPESGRPLVVLDGVQDPGNVGTIARTALALGATGILSLPGTVDLTNPKVVRSAAGSLFRLPHLSLDSVALLKWIDSSGIELWASTMDGDPIKSTPTVGVALLLGNEGAGIGHELLARVDRRVGISIGAGSESLNVAVAAGILLHQLGKR